MSPPSPLASERAERWLSDATHRRFLSSDAARTLDLFRKALRPDGGFYTLNWDGTARADIVQELFYTTRMVHSFALGKLAGAAGCDEMIDAGLRYLASHHRDAQHGGYLWGVTDDGIADGRKLAYGHVFVLLAGSSAKLVGHPEADALIADVSEVLDRHYWEDGPGLFADEWNRDWTPFSSYRGMNANMHGVEALLAAFEATGEALYRDRAGRILDFFMNRIAPAHGQRLPEHYKADWTPWPEYSENPMFRPAGTTPGHSFELARLMLQHWDLSGRPDTGAPQTATAVATRALSDAWRADGGFVYTLDFDGSPAIRDRYWWPVTEAIGVLASLIKLEHSPEHEAWYQKLWRYAEAHCIDHTHGGWFPEINETGAPVQVQFTGKPDIYHSLQAALYPQAPGLSRQAEGLAGLL